MSALHRLLRRRLTTPLIITGMLFILAGGFIHLREWLDVYRHVPADAPGAAVVRVGFPINAAMSVVVVAALLLTMWWRTRLARHVVLAALLFQAGSLAALIATRTGSLLGWTEPTWTHGANQTRAVELGALLCLAAVAAIAASERHTRRRAAPLHAAVRS